MKRIALIAALAFGAAAPAFAAMDLGVTSPAELAAMNNFDTDFMAPANLGVTSAAELSNMAVQNDDIISTQDLRTIEKLGVTSPAELSVLH